MGVGNMMTNTVLVVAGAAMENDAKKRINADANHTGADDVEGTAELAVAKFVQTMNFDPSHLSDLKSLENLQSAFQAGADAIGELIKNGAAGE